MRPAERLRGGEQLANRGGFRRVRLVRSGVWIDRQA
jgi:hypothetical protein